MTARRAVGIAGVCLGAAGASWFVSYLVSLGPITAPVAVALFALSVGSGFVFVVGALNLK